MTILLKRSPNVELSFPQQSEGSNVFSGTKTGTLFLTSYRVIFITSRSISDPMLSFMMPFDLMTNLTVEQPVFAANFIKGTIQAAPYGGWEGQATFKLVFRNGGAIEFAQLMVKAASSAARGFPLRTLNDWFSSMGVYVITGEGNICTPHMPCSVIAYGAPPAGYGAPSPGSGAPPAGYGAPPPRYGAPPAGYGAQPAGNEGPPVGHRASPAGYGAPPRGYEAPPAGNEGLPAVYRASPAGSGARPHESAAAQAPENEASLPSASSS
ncbi:PREDICTED: postacrosomal sheath WW domain-binding protein isoform X2 [Rhinopithecus bieti]|uniref:postacrosomal sheath WW domain-binding protein isoform X2 n=1 Tax=Rhinopithecus bieti TaxID=61621 RepID=UPI00083C2F80|nr:PREDICTED: postacrosomal sheath WW domain-binding protein isoform X2 [Rhinopithecus bieti]